MRSVLFSDRFDALSRPFVGPRHVLRILHAALVVNTLDSLGRVKEKNAAVQDCRLPEVTEARRVHLGGVLLVAGENSVI